MKMKASSSSPFIEEVIASSIYMPVFRNYPEHSLRKVYEAIAFVSFTCIYYYMILFDTLPWPLTRFTVIDSEVVLVDDSVLVILVRGEVELPHLISVVINLLDDRSEARHVCRVGELLVICPLPFNHLVYMPHLRINKQ